MSQQEFFQGSQEEQQPLNEEAIEYSRYWSSKPNAPKEEYYDEPMVQGDYYDGYMAQDARSAYSATTNDSESRFSESSASAGKEQSQKQQHRFSPDGDAFEQRYRPYTRPQWSVPPWARPQKQKRSVGKIVLFLVLALLLIKPVLILIAIFGALFLGVAIVGLMLLFPILLMGIPYIIIRGFQRRWRYTNSWRVSPTSWRRRW